MEETTRTNIITLYCFPLKYPGVQLFVEICKRYYFKSITHFTVYSFSFYCPKAFFGFDFSCHVYARLVVYILEP